MARTVIFDVGNVLIQWDIRRLYRQLLAVKPSMPNFTCPELSRASSSSAGLLWYRRLCGSVGPEAILPARGMYWR